MQIESFLSLVSNPEQFKQHLKDLKDREDALNKAIESHGVLGDILAARKEAQEATEKAKADADAVLKQADEAATKQREVLSTLADELQVKTAKAADQLSAARHLEAQSKQVIAEYEAKTKKLDKQIEHQFLRERALAEKETEVEARLAKLRSVMV